MYTVKSRALMTKGTLSYFEDQPISSFNTDEIRDDSSRDIFCHA